MIIKFLDLEVVYDARNKVRLLAGHAIVCRRPSTPVRCRSWTKPRQCSRGGTVKRFTRACWKILFRILVSGPRVERCRSAGFTVAAAGAELLPVPSKDHAKPLDVSVVLAA
jgi:hypothetical protein